MQACGGEVHGCDLGVPRSRIGQAPQQATSVVVADARGVGHEFVQLSPALGSRREMHVDGREVAPSRWPAILAAVTAGQQVRPFVNGAGVSAFLFSEVSDIAHQWAHDPWGQWIDAQPILPPSAGTWQSSDVWPEHRQRPVSAPVTLFLDELVAGPAQAPVGAMDECGHDPGGMVEPPRAARGTFTLCTGQWVALSDPVADCYHAVSSCIDHSLAFSPRVRWTPDRDDVREAMEEWGREEADPQITADTIAAHLWAEAARRVGRFLPGNCKPVNVPIGIPWPSWDPAPEARRGRASLEGQLRLWVPLVGPLEMLEALESFSAWSLVIRHPPQEGLKPVTAAALDLVPHLPPADEGRVRMWHLYVDGSCDHDWTGWGVAVLCSTQDGVLHWVGSLWSECLHIAAASEEGGSNNSAELHAAAWASLIAISLPGLAAVTVWYDNGLVAGAINASCCIASHPWLAKFITVVASVVRGRRHLSAQHIKSHTGHPWNELADTLAAGRQTDLAPCHACIPLAQASLIELEALEHLVYMGASDDGSLPTLSHGGFWLCQPDGPRLPATHSLSHKPAVAGTGGTRVISLAVGQANVLSLGTADEQETDGLLEPGRIHHLSEQWRALGLDIVCVHEARSDGPLVRPSGDFWAFTSGCTTGRTHGEEVWVSRAKPLCINGDPVSLTPADVCVILAEPTILLLSVQAKDTCLYVLSAHAPPSSAKQRIDCWWDHLDQSLADLLPANAVLIVGIDANGRPPSAVEGVTGDLAAGRPDKAGRRLADLCARHGLCLPQTWAAFHMAPIGHGRMRGWVVTASTLSLGHRARRTMPCRRRSDTNATSQPDHPTTN